MGLILIVVLPHIGLLIALLAYLIHGTVRGIAQLFLAVMAEHRSRREDGQDQGDFEDKKKPAPAFLLRPAHGRWGRAR